VVVGFGAAGVCAALQARADGASVIAVDRFEGGGATKLSGGVSYSGGTDVQSEAGFQDTAEEMFKYLQKQLRGSVSDETLRKFCAASQDDINWLRSHGVRYRGTFEPERVSFPAEGKYLYYTGNELLPEYLAVAKPAPRGHRPVGKWLGGAHLYTAISQSALNNGVKLVPHSPAVRLVVDESGRVIGVEVLRLNPGTPAHKRHEKLKGKFDAYIRYIGGAKAERVAEELSRLESEGGERLLIRARRGVVLSTGGFMYNPEMVKKYAPLYYGVTALGTVSCDGSGIHLGLSVGGDIDCMHRVAPWRQFNRPILPTACLNGIVVNAAGRRFVSEDAYSATMGEYIVERAGGNAWLIFDRSLYRRALRAALPGGPGNLAFGGLLSLLVLIFGIRKGRSLEKLAQRLQIDSAGLRETLTGYNQSIEREEPDEFGKQQRHRQSLTREPYYAVPLSFTNKLLPGNAITLGGLRVSEETGNVKRADGSSIPGLYAAGRAAVGIPSQCYVSGTSIADCVFSGRRAGHSAALQDPAAKLESSTVAAA
ncbi:MAG TPA: FAD-binding protein, partial [Steroidobacteraceae bacterium]|nr:FAD-binding protein [Steroidobacteraceae bacterium]